MMEKSEWTTLTARKPLKEGHQTLLELKKL
jgi:hypothetical protein